MSLSSAIDPETGPVSVAASDRARRRPASPEGASAAPPAAVTEADLPLVSDLGTLAYRVAIRCVDVGLSLITLIVLAPLMAIIALVRLNPVLFASLTNPVIVISGSIVFLSRRGRSIARFRGR